MPASMWAFDTLWPSDDYGMCSRLCFAFFVFYLTGILVFAVHLRAANNRIFNRLCTYRGEQSRLKQQLWQKQLRLESLMNPATVSDRLDR